jgi:hypothetical protein
VKLLLANIDYTPGPGCGHTTDEGDQFQRALEHAGWTLAGAGFGDGCRDVRVLLERFEPELVLVHDKRDLDPASGICFRPGLLPEHLGELAKRRDILKLAVVKDAGSSIEYHRQFCEEIGADGVVTYYHHRSVLNVSPWLKDYLQIRTYHTVDARRCAALNLELPRRRALVSGAVSKTYPLRKLVMDNARQIGVEVLRHPGYRNKGTFTPAYLETLSRYRVHVATCSSYAFALRKIIESVAVGTTPVTNLPSYDVLPAIEGALVRVSPSATLAEVWDAVDAADRTWNLEERLEYAKAAQLFYDFRTQGERLSVAIDMTFRRDRAEAFA